MRITRPQLQPIGIDLGRDSIKMLQLQVVDNSLVGVARSKESLPDELPEDAAQIRKLQMDAVSRALQSGGFSGRRVIASLPREIVHVKNLRLPLMPADEVADAVAFEARNVFPIDPDTAVIRHIPAGEVRQGNDTRLEVIALAASSTEIENYVEQLHRAGCALESLDFEPCAIYRGIERFVRRREDEHEVHVLVDIGLRETQVIVGRGRDMSFYKPISFGSLQLRHCVARKLGITPSEAKELRRRFIETGVSGEASVADVATADPVRRAAYDGMRGMIEDLAREISLCLRYYSVTFRGQRPIKVRLSGGEAADPQLLTLLRGLLPIPVETNLTLNNIDLSPIKSARRAGTSSEWATAFGLAMKQVVGYFGAKEGRKRTAPPLPPAASPSDVEVVDIAAVAGEGSNARA
jgi:type IV pilus assembly protein PilM